MDKYCGLFMDLLVILIPEFMDIFIISGLSFIMDNIMIHKSDSILDFHGFILDLLVMIYGFMNFYML